MDDVTGSKMAKVTDFYPPSSLAEIYPRPFNGSSTSNISSTIIKSKNNASIAIQSNPNLYLNPDGIESISFFNSF